MRFRFTAALAVLACLSLSAMARERPLFRDFAGLCVHTIQFKPELYKPTVSVVRDYHPLKWDVGDDTAFATTFPFAKNRVDWSQVYGSWKKAGYRTSASIMFDDVEPKEWKDLSKDAFAYGEAFARYFGPGGQDLVQAAEVGNEPGKYDDATYRTLFEAMARGFRQGDPKMQIATCAMNLGPSGRYSKSVDLLKGLDSLWDILNIHIYPEVEGWPTWKRSFPEDPNIEFLRHLEHVLTWRRENAKDKPVWLTEWGYDSSTKPAPPSGTFSKWVGINDEQQANWVTRGFLVLAATELDRGYLYFFNDSDEPQVHGSSGLTRNFKPKPAFYAVSFLQRAIGDYRLAQVHSASVESGYIQEWVHGTHPKQRVTIAWYPQGETRVIDLPVPKDRVVDARLIPLSENGEEAAEVAASKDGKRIQVQVGERPVVVRWTAR